MWTRAELKDRAKFAFKRNYWRSVLISLLLALLIGGGSGAGSAGSAVSSALGSDGSDITSDSYDDFYDDADDIWYEMNDVYDNTDHTALLFAGVIFVVIFMIVFVIIMTVTIILDAFIFNPLEVGCKRFYLRNLNEAALVGNAGYAFDKNYKNIAGSIDTQRTSISGVDGDEEAINLVKYQNGYNLASKMVQTLTEIYDRLILQTGV